MDPVQAVAIFRQWIANAPLSEGDRAQLLAAYETLNTLAQPTE